MCIAPFQHAWFYGDKDTGMKEVPIGTPCHCGAVIWNGVIPDPREAVITELKAAVGRVQLSGETYDFNSHKLIVDKKAFEDMCAALAAVGWTE
jgi:hypothetical protein